MNLNFAHNWIALSEILWDLNVERAEWVSWVAIGEAPDATVWAGDDALLPRHVYEAWIASRIVDDGGQP